jgi:uncharacterized protein (DUF1778 family)
MPMPRTAERKDQPISMRLPASDLAIIDRAAGLRGRSRTEFMRDAALREAESVLIEDRLVTLTPEGFDAFLAILNEPARPVPEIVEVMRRQAPWERSSD